jgi:hypothetical protein
MRLWTLLLLVACGTDADGDGSPASEDCDDAEAAVSPMAREVCDGVDNDCDGAVDDEDDDALGPRWYADADGDGYGGALLGRFCAPPPGAIRDPGDCDDAVFEVNPGSEEVCDGLDNDCDGRTDADDLDLGPDAEQFWYRDNDGDGYGTPIDFVRSCEQPVGYVADNTDCDDSDEGGARHPGAPEVCDGQDNDCDIADGVLIDDDDPDVDYSNEPVLYLDRDGDGFGEEGSAFQSCNPPRAVVQQGGDCDDDNPAVNVDAEEVCDGFDNDCDGLSDGLDWYDDAWPYRVTVQLTTPNRFTNGTPIAVDVDFANALLQVGDSTGLDPDSVRVVLQDCVLDYPVQPAEFVDGVSGLFDPVPMADPLGDESGAVVWVHDEDEDLSTPDELARSSTVVVGVYFGSQGDSPGVGPYVPPSPLSVSVSAGDATLDSGVVTAHFDAALGGLTDELGIVGGSPTIGAQTASAAGNGAFMNGWVSARDVVGSLSLVHEGPVLGMVRAEGALSNASGTLDYTHDSFVFAGRPDVYTKMRWVTAVDSQLGPQGAQWGAAVRPWQIDAQATLATYGGVGRGVEDPAFSWARSDFGADAEGVYLGYRTSPLQRHNPVTVADGRFLALAGQDVAQNPPTNQVDLPAGTAVLDHAVVVVYPFVGSFEDAQFDALGSMDGVSAVVGTATTRP